MLIQTGSHLPKLSLRMSPCRLTSVGDNRGPVVTRVRERLYLRCLIPTKRRSLGWVQKGRIPQNRWCSVLLAS